MEDPIKKKLELDIEVTPTSLSTNPYMKWIHIAKTIDAYRIFPRVFVMWFMKLDEPNLEQAGLVSVVVGAMAAVFGIYAGTSGQSKKFKGEE